MLYADSSANHTAPSGAVDRRASFAIGVESVKDDTTPSLDTREIDRIGLSVYHATPSRSTARPSGSKLWRPFGIRTMRSFLSKPMAYEKSFVNHTTAWAPQASGRRSART